MADNKPDNTVRLAELLKFDPSKRPSPTKALLEEVLSDLQKERDVKAKDAARVQLTEAIKLREEMHKVRSEFEKQYRKFDDQLGKILNALENSLRGRPTQEETAEAPATGGETAPAT